MHRHSTASRQWTSTYLSGAYPGNSLLCPAPRMRIGRNWLRLASIAVFLCLAIGSGLCQQTASLSGTVIDSDGLVIPNATVTLIERQTGATKTAQSDSAGAYSFASLSAGNYTLRTSASGFKVGESVYTLAEGQNATLPLSLTLANYQQSVSVTAQADPYGVVPTEPTDSVFGFPDKPVDIPRSVSTVDSSLLNLYSARTVNDLVTVVPGSYTAAYFGVPGSVFLRGDVADNYFRGFRRVENRGNYATVISASDHIEIVKGPPSPIYGPGRIGGFMNFYPKTARSEAAKWMETGHGAISFIYGQYDKKIGGGEYGMPFKIGKYRSGVYAFFEANDSHSFYNGIDDRYKIGQIAFNMELSPKLSLAYGFQGFHSEGNQNLGWNRVTQELIDHQMYQAGTPTIDLSSNGQNIGANDIALGALDCFAFQQDMSTQFAATCPSQDYALNPASMHMVKLDYNQIMIDKEDFLQATTYTGYFDINYQLKSSVSIKNQSFYDHLASYKYSTYGFGAAYTPGSFENKTTLSLTLRPSSVISFNAYTGFGYNHVTATSGEERNSYQTVDRRDISVGATPNDRFQGPFNSSPQIAYPYFSSGKYEDLGLFWLSELSLWEKLVLTTGARFDRYTPDFWGRYSGEPDTHGVATNNAGTYNASLSYRSRYHITPYFTAASSRYLDLGQGNELDATEIPTGAYIQPSNLYEAGAKAADTSGKYYFSAAFYRQKRSSEDSQTQQIDYFRSKGVEIEARVFALKRISFTGALTWQNPLELNAPFILGIPPSLLNVTPQQAYGGRFIGYATIFPHTGPYQVAGQPHWVASPFATVNVTKNVGFLVGTTWASSVVAGYVNGIVLPSYAIWRGSVFYRTSRYQANINFNNLFDAKSFQSQYLFEDSLIKPGELRTVSGTIKYTF
jgi:iron complex outermembrane receptor protein